MLKTDLSYDVAVVQWITSCHKYCMTTRIITLWHIHVTSLTTSLSTMFSFEIMFILKAIKSNFLRSYAVYAIWGGGEGVMVEGVFPLYRKSVIIPV